MPASAFNPRVMPVFLHDCLAAALAWIAGYWLRFNLSIPPSYLDDVMHSLVWVVPSQALLFWWFGLYRGLWRYAGLPDMQRILKAVGLAAMAVPMLLQLVRVDAVVPRTVLVADPVLLLLFMGGSRLIYRAWREHRLPALLVSRASPVLIAGAGSAADLLLRDLRHGSSQWQAVGLLDDEPAKLGRQLQGVPVLGPLEDLPQWAEKMAVQDVVLALPSTSASLRRRLTRLCADSGLRVLTVPSLAEILEGRSGIAQLRPIELEDLLGREPVTLDDPGLAGFIGGRIVLVTGAGGSIGSELCRQIARYQPARLVMIEQSEFALYRMEQEFATIFPQVPVVCVIGDVKDAGRMGAVMAFHRPRVVFHAAAYKHVPLMECVNAFEAMRNNVMGTRVCAEAAVANAVEKFVLVSTDKAVNPTNVMGASKRMAEMVCEWMQGRNVTRFISVRFGNVLGSSGSVVPKFQEQIASGGPVTVTHPDITRFFMTIQEAAQLVLQAGFMGQGGEIFVLDMGEPVRIADLARLMIRLVGKTEEDIGIEFTGLRPGEKLHEELLADTETTLPTPHPKLRVARSRKVDVPGLTRVLQWVEGNTQSDDSTVRAYLRECVPEYQPRV